jgi:hypothetical protein
MGVWPVHQDRSERARMAWHYAKVLGIAYPVWVAAFEIVGFWAARLPTVDLTSQWDRALPLVPAFVWPYEACYLLPVLSLMVIKDWHRFNVAMVGILLANLAAFVVYVMLPVAFAHPTLGSSISERVLALEYAADFHPGANNLPSMHVAMSWIMICAMWGQPQSRGANMALGVLVVLLTVAPVLVKQHLLLDAVIGAPWGVAAYWVAGRAYRRLVARGERAPDALARLFAPWRWGAR